jgi:hypothetical protein
MKTAGFQRENKRATDDNWSSVCPNLQTGVTGCVQSEDKADKWKGV